MKNNSFRTWYLVGIFAVFAGLGRAQVVQFNANLNSAQESPASTSGATGSAIMLYDVTANTFDLIVTINNFGNTITASHIHEGAVGVPGPVVTGLGSETVYTRNGNTLTATFRGITHLGSKLTLLQNGAYYNVHSTQFPGGEIRGQLIAQPVKLVALIDNAQERAAFPATAFNATAQAYGAAVMSYNPGTGAIRLRISVYNFTNTLNNSHFHEGAPGVSGGVVVNLGSSVNTTFPNGGSYSTLNGVMSGTFDIPYVGATSAVVPDPIKLLTGGAYLNFHSTTFSGGETRGQVRVSSELPSSRVINLSTRGFVGAGNQVLIEGVTVSGPDPVRLLISAKGPSLAAFGVTGALADPVITLYDSAGRAIATNNDIGAIAPTSELASIPGVPTNPVESALLVVLPPGTYSAVVTGNNGATGIALLEAMDLRTLNGNLTATGVIAAAPAAPNARATSTAQNVIELCVGVPLAVTAVKR